MKSFIVILLCVSQIWALPKGVRIIGGHNAYAGEFPYAAAIYKSTSEGRYFCTGSLLSNQWVLTAGQCVDGATSFTIVLGTHKLDGDSANVQKLATDEFVLHPDYNPTTLENDIGLIKLRMPVTFSIYIRRLYLPFSDLPNSIVGVAFGWGQTSDDNADLSNTLQYVNLSEVSDEECKITYGDQVAENMVCFEGNYNEGTCFGDTGSPIILHVSRGYTIVVAVASFFSSNGCESTDPSGYTRVFPYNDWIKNVTELPM
ncbi:brachyurin [Tribolium castaneum]|uniref:Serine protease H116 n=1 Tax=Tribolium castaneum TaxID=7070 RepID=D6WN54_TRICA|nr:PREDICTED: brachyurin [Tribolium castaneum]EFA04554.1 serine protease H116 [Tribolium castaneum]|eukprot:XP_968927.3 PREDICTED: brachyurin [Tribolium castaneum]